LLPPLKEAAIFITDVMNNVLEWALEGDNLVDTLKAIGITLGVVAGVVVVYKGAILAASLAGKAYAVMQGIMAVATGVYAAATAAAAAGTGVFSAAVKALTAAMALNPIGLIAVGVTLLIVGLIALVKNFDTVKFHAVDFAQTAAIWMLNLGLVIYGSVIRMVGKLAGQLSKLPGPFSRMFAGVQTGAQIAVGAMERARDTLIRNQAASRAAYEASKAQNAREAAAERGRVDQARGTTAGLAQTYDQRAKAFQEMLERMYVSNSSFQTRLRNDAVKFFEGQAALESETAAGRLAWLTEQLDAINKVHFASNEQRLAAESGLRRAIQNEEKKLVESRLEFGKQVTGAAGEMLRDLQTTFKNAGKESRALAYAMKAVAMAEAAINSYLAFTKALAAFPPPYNFIAAGITLAAGLAKQAAIASTPIPSAQTGIQDYRVPDVRSARNDRAAVMASPGESVTVTPRGEDVGGRTEINIKIEEDAIFRVVTKGIKTGRIDISNRNLGSGVFPS